MAAKMRQSIVNILHWCMEAVVIVLVCLSPWAFGSNRPLFEYLLFTGIAILMALWGLRVLFEWRFHWVHCPVVILLSAMFVLGLFQMFPLTPTTLSWLSPSTQEIYDYFLPEQGEILPNGETVNTNPFYTISFYPEGTRQVLLRLFGAILVFSCIRANLVSWGSFFRLAIAIGINGLLLAVFGIVQFFTAEQGSLYWTFETRGANFGPFINRNHFAFYLNICIGLVAGLLLYHWNVGERQNPDYPRLGWGWRTYLHKFLHQPKILWLLMISVFMVSSVGICLSRGGLTSLLVGMLTATAFAIFHTRKWNLITIPFLVLLFSLPLVCWFGFELVETRMATLVDENVLEENRFALWAQVMPMALDYPICGTGYGSFPYIEPLTRNQQEYLGYYGVSHAHNDFVEALIEGGLLRLGLSLALVGIIFRYGISAFGRAKGNNKWLVLGGLWAFSSVVFHSFWDFSIHIPANGLLVTVLSAYLVGLGTLTASEDPNTERTGIEKNGISMGGAAPIFAGVTAVALGWLLISEGNKIHQAEQLRLAALYNELEGNPDHLKSIQYLKGAIFWQPDNVYLRTELGEIYLQQYEKESKTLTNRKQAYFLCRAIAAGFYRNHGGIGSSLAEYGCLVAAAKEIDDSLFQSWKKQSNTQYLTPALAQFIKARNSCPLMELPHVRLAAFTQEMVQADSQRAYLNRARRILQADPQLCFICGVQEIQSNNQEDGYRCWNRSLMSSEKYLLPILKRCQKLNLSKEEIAGKILPYQPHMLTEAAEFLFPEDPEKQKPFLRKAVAAFKKQTKHSPADHYLKAKLLVKLEEWEDGFAAFEDALALKPHKAKWRYEYSKVLYQRGELNKAKRQLRTLKLLSPHNDSADSLYLLVLREIRDKRSP